MYRCYTICKCHFYLTEGLEHHGLECLKHTYTSLCQVQRITEPVLLKADTGACGFLLREQYGKKLKLVEVQSSWATERKWTLGFNIREKMLLILPSGSSEENLGQDWRLWQNGGFGWKAVKKFDEIFQCSAIKYRSSKNNLGEKWGTEVLKKDNKVHMNAMTYLQELLRINILGEHTYTHIHISIWRPNVHWDKWKSWRKEDQRATT